MRRRRRIGAAVIAGCTLLLAACTATSAPGASTSSAAGTAGSAAISLGPTGGRAPTGGIAPTQDQVSTSSTARNSAPSVDPVTVEGMITGPGVDDASISLGMIVDPAADRGFTSGVTLWRDIVNAGGGICGRTIQITSAPPGSTTDEAYTQLGRSTLGLVLLEPGGPGRAVVARIRADRIPTLTPEGTPHDLPGAGSPVVLGATDDILAINAAAHLLSSGAVPRGGSLGVLLDDSASAADIRTGLSWWADRNDIRLVDLHLGEPVPTYIQAIFAEAAPQGIMDLLSATSIAGTGPATTGSASGGSGSAGPAVEGTAGGTRPADAARGPIIVTTLNGYLPEFFPADAVGRLQVATVTPSPGADHPGVKAVRTAFADSGRSNPGPRLLEGYATGETWARLLEPMCAARTLTRTAIAEQLRSLAPASSDSLFGPTDPAVQLSSGLSASKVSAMSNADPTAPGGLQPITLLESAPGIGGYRAG